MDSDASTPEPFAAPAPGEAPSPEQSSPILARNHEPLPVLILGILMFCGLLGFIWLMPREQQVKSSQLISSLQARMGTYAVQEMVHDRLLGQRPELPWVERVERRRTLTTADEWARISREAHDPADRGKTALNAAALYGAAERDPLATTALKQAATRDPERAAIYRAFLPLYAPKPSAVRIAPDMAALLTEISGGPLITARNAELAGKHSTATAVLAPGARMGARVTMISMLFGLTVFGIIITAILIWILAIVGKHLTLPNSSPVSWGVGTALIFICLTYVVSDLLLSGLAGLLPALKADIMPLRVVANLCGFAITASVLLAATGHAPWHWSVLGWRFSWRNAGMGVLGLIAVVPVVGAAAWLSAMLLGGGRGSAHPLIPQLITAPNIWVVIILAGMAVVVAPLVEETLFRGLLFRALDARIAFWPAACISGFLFALVHGEVVVLAPITLLGITFAYLTKRSNSLLAPAVAHAIQNGGATAMIVLFAWASRSFGG